MQVIRVVEHTPNLFERGLRAFNAMPPVAQIGLIATVPVVAVASAVVGLELAAAGGIVAGLAALSGVVGPESTITETSKLANTLTGARDCKGNPLAVGERYAQHPRCSDVYLTTECFHHDIIREQQTHLISFIRSQVRVRRLTISISYEDEESFSAEVLDSRFGSKRKISGSMLSDLIYESPKIVEPPSNLFWLDYFTNMREALREAGSGNKSFKETFGRNLQCDAHIAKRFGFKSEATKVYCMNVMVEAF